MTTEPTAEFLARRERIATVVLHGLLTSRHLDRLQLEGNRMTEEAVRIAELLIHELKV